MSKANRYRHDRLQREIYMDTFIITLIAILPTIGFLLGRWSCTW